MNVEDNEVEGLFAQRFVSVFGEEGDLYTQERWGEERLKVLERQPGGPLRGSRGSRGPGHRLQTGLRQREHVFFCLKKRQVEGNPQHRPEHLSGEVSGVLIHGFHLLCHRMCHFEPTLLFSGGGNSAGLLHPDSLPIKSSLSLWGVGRDDAFRREGAEDGPLGPNSFLPLVPFTCSSVGRKGTA